MALVHEFETQGNVLFRNRSWIPIFFVLAGLLWIYFKGLNPWLNSEWQWLAVCSLFVFLGQWIRAHAIGFSENRTSGRNTSAGQVAEAINKTGMYSMLRHPLYLGNYFMWLGALLFIGSIEFLLLSSFAYWLYYERIMFAEEQFLRNKFGAQAYDEWSKNTPAILPKLSNYRPASLSFDWKDSIRREYLGFCAAYFVICIFSIFALSLQQSSFAYSQETATLLLVNTTLFLVIRLLAKRTACLQPRRLQI